MALTKDVLKQAERVTDERLAMLIADAADMPRTGYYNGAATGEEITALFKELQSYRNGTSMNVDDLIWSFDDWFRDHNEGKTFEQKYMRPGDRADVGFRALARALGDYVTAMCTRGVRIQSRP